MKHLNKFTAYIALGGNLGDVVTSMTKAINLLTEIAHIKKCSSLYKTPPWGNVKQPDFLNACIKITTNLKAEKLLEYCQNIENKLERQRTEKWGARTIDLDLLFHSETKTYISNKLILPHPYMFERAFVLVPLCEIEPNLLINNKTIKDYAGNMPNEELDKILLANNNKKWKTIV